MTDTPDPLARFRRDAKTLRRAHEAGEAHAAARMANHPPRRDGRPLRHADYLHVIARENSFASWPAMKLAVETRGLDRATKQQRLAIAMHYGQFHVVDELLRQTPDLVSGHLALEVGFYDLDAVRRAVEADPAVATRAIGTAPPLVHLCRSRMIHRLPERRDAMLAIADLLVRNGADVNGGVPVAPGEEHRLSPLYFAIGEADNLALAQWLLEHGADPDDNESLYHSTELGHHDGLRLLLRHGANPRGTNALLRAMDFHDHEAVRMLLEAGAEPDDFNGDQVGGEAPWVVPALHQAARRMSDRRMVEMLLDAGADPARRYQGASAYGYARVFGNEAVARAIDERGAAVPLTPEETLLARAAEGQDSPGAYLDPEKLPEAYRNIIRMILHLPGKLPHLKALVALGLEYDRPDTEGLTPVQVAGWEGLPEVMGYLMSLKPDLSHINGYGGTLLSTIIHGSENCPNRAERDYIGCLELALHEGVALPRRAADLAGDPEVSSFLADWAERHPGQVVEGGAA